MSMSSREARELDNWITREPDPECKWHEGMSAIGCSECRDEYEASLPDTVKEAEGWA